MASHRKPRTRILQTAASRNGAVSVTTAALASVTLLSTQSAVADPRDDEPTLEEVRQRVDTLYRQAGAETQRYNAAKEKADAQRDKVDGLLDQVARRAGEVNDARRALGQYAAAQYRTGGLSGTATLLLSEDPQGYFTQRHVMKRMTARQQQAVETFAERKQEAARKRGEAQRELSTLTTSQDRLRESKKDVQGKLSDARDLLSELTAEEKARLAAAERRREAEARRKAEEAERRREEQREREEEAGDPGGGTDTPATGTAKVIAFAEAQLGKPYVWGATGPNSYDCSGLTQDAWAAAGVSLPRTTYDQVEVGTTVPRSQMQPGDLVFFYADVTHVGIYVGNGQMIHAPKPGDVIKYESIDYMPFHSAVRPA
ncbi:NlpC/P60 family protein [Streptomyces sp. DSM 42041]|uniref:NlpC/P60 family protein n=1 Tax=Streptomyces hazeniae TaxID=3075538 RepID=A0ABU2NY02_9ACTN|nr:NlpC/P60 family protein [Streptomyces sp. DSM 42041]MDT0380508.1 NlpC/P60 family protein [Streptomyces sp. DSM 42041]